ncbi:hypothetical protein BOW53_03040 [Solemya pervernicosa gill symbiont]|uniref:Uncharacterized protein n=1 Tax=Solemya pervernicosa gill symbiont TaxID=642797 RepID=A0A1T2L987_9GAMM|nr:hypothetical protein [Solemya pervernicosa gill symbiont]OOZ41669.1 hypothetical protein BOW53_03040 [Solemya pervernicosa gill symbiont]
MALKLMSDNFTAEVSLSLPDDDKMVKRRFNARFKSLEKSEIDALVNANSDDGGDAALLNQVLLGWDGLRDLDGNLIEYSEENQAEVFEATPYTAAMVRAYFAKLNGGRGKN